MSARARRHPDAEPVLSPEEQAEYARIAGEVVRAAGHVPPSAPRLSPAPGSHDFSVDEAYRWSDLLGELLTSAKAEHTRTANDALERKTQIERDIGLMQAEFFACMARQFNRWSSEFEKLARKLEKTR